MRSFLLLIILVVVAACGSASKCDRATCSGCCDQNNECQIGNNQLACGTGGLQCQVCPQNTLCSVGFCALTSGNGGGSGGGSGGGNGGGTGGGGTGGGGTGGGLGGGPGGGGTGGGLGGGTGGGTGGGFGGGTGGGTGGGGSSSGSYTVDGVVISGPYVSCMSSTSYQYLVATQSPSPGFLAYFPPGTLPSQTWNCVANPTGLQPGQSSIALSDTNGTVHICQSGTVTTTMTAGKLTVIVNNLTVNQVSGDGGMPTRVVSARLTCP